MKIILYKNKSEDIVVNKDIEELLVVEGTLRDSTDLLTPSILFTDIDIAYIKYSSDMLNVLDSDYNKLFIFTNTLNIMSANYLYIEEFNRYYYIVNKTFERNNLIRLDLGIDVLMSHKANILNQTAYVKRNEFTFNMFHIDTLLPKTSKYVISSERVGDVHAIRYDMTGSSASNGNTPCYIVTYTTLEETGSYGTTTPFNQYVLLTSEGFKQFATKINEIPSVGEGNWVANKSDYILNVLALPFTPVQADNLSMSLSIKIGNTEITLTSSRPNTPVGCDYGYLPLYDAYIFFGALEGSVGEYNPIDIEVNDFTDTFGFCDFIIYLPWVGYRKISSSRLQDGNTSIYIVYYIDYTTGRADCIISKSIPYYNEVYGTYVLRAGDIIEIYEANVGYRIPIGSLNSAYLASTMYRQDARENAVIATGISNVTKSGANALSSYAANPNLLASITNFAAGAGSAIIDALNQKNLIEAERDSNVGNYSGGSLPLNSLTSMYGDCVPVLYKIKPEYYIPENYNHLFGRPLNEVVPLSSLSGFTVIGDMHYNIDKELTTEVNMIISALSNGVILP